MATSNSHHAALISSPGMGHIIPILELSKRLVTHQIIRKVTLFIPSINNTSNSSSSKAEAHVLQSAIKKEENFIKIIHLPQLDIDNEATIETKIAIVMKELPQQFCCAISNMEIKPTILIIDFFVSQALPLAQKLIKIPMYVFAPTNAWFVALSFHTPTLDKEVQGEFSNLDTHISIPGCKPVHPSDLFDMLRDRTHRLYHEYLRMCEGVTLADGIFVNTFHELEPKTLAGLGSGLISNVPVFPIGPLIRETKQNCDEKISYVVNWLDKQEEESVIYISFGSGYTVSYEQIKEMALGLELSEKKFVWSLRPPSNKKGPANYITAGEENIDATKFESSHSSFPDEFYRVQKNGIVVMDWAPQLDILRHPSIGGFVTHCGWNSVLESVTCGVPMVGFPFFAEQKMNAAMLEEEVGIAIRVDVTVSSRQIEGREYILAKAIKKIIDKEDNEGCAMRKRVKELKDIAKRAWSQDGDSYLALSKINHSNRLL